MKKLLYCNLNAFQVLFCSFFFLLNGFSQAEIQPKNINSIVLNTTFNQYQTSLHNKRVFLKMKNKNPLLFTAASLLFIYQNVISEQISAGCIYETSCSEYMKKNIEKNGLLLGVLLGIHQLSCCQKSIEEQMPAHRISVTGKIINPID